MSRLRQMTVFMLAGLASAQSFHPDIPRVWRDADLSSFEVPLARADHSPRYLSEAEYYALKAPPIYRAYPVYAPGRAPAGYLEGLKQKDPEIAFEPANLRTREDWVRAGEIVFRAARTFTPAETGIAQSEEGVRALKIPATREGIIPYFQYVVRKKGVVELGPDACAACHTRVLPDGTAVYGAQGNFPWSRRGVWVRSHETRPNRDDLVSRQERTLFAAPWIDDKCEMCASTFSEWVRRFTAMQPGVIAREGTSSAYPVHVPSLVGIRDLRYLDATGLTRHRSIEDLMRYAIVNQGFAEGLQMTARYGEDRPAAQNTQRYSDEQLYALALFLYSLEPPPNPNHPDETARRGQRVFEQNGCAGCHVPPLYTNNKLTPVAGFRVPPRLKDSEQVLNVSVGTDPSLALRTRRGTGFYKVPSLRGVWYRNAFGHMGQAETLEEWFDPARLQNDYVPKGFHLGSGPIRGHEFGLALPAADRAALIAFLRTL